MASEDFIAVAGDDWYQRRRDDDEGKFFRRVSDQAGKFGDGTRQGIYVLTVDGTLLIRRNHHDPDVMRQVLVEGLQKFRNLPAERRRPGAMQVGKPDRVDANYHREPPKGGLVVNVHTRIL